MTGLLSVALPAFVGAATSLLVNGCMKWLDRSFFAGRDRRRILRDMELDMLRDVILEMRDLSIDCWRKDSSDRTLEQARTAAAISGRLGLVANIVSDMLGGVTQDKHPLDVAMGELVENCAGHDEFGQPKRTVRPELYTGIEISAYSLIRRANCLKREI